MEGAYNQVFKARKDVPSDTYNYFMDMLMDTVRYVFHLSSLCTFTRPSNDRN